MVLWLRKGCPESPGRAAGGGGEGRCLETRVPSARVCVHVGGSWEVLVGLIAWRISREVFCHRPRELYPLPLLCPVPFKKKIKISSS